MDGLLTPIRTTYLKNRNEEPLLVELKSTERNEPGNSKGGKITKDHVTNSEEALEVLKSEPDYDTLISVLGFLARQAGVASLTQPSPLNAQITQALVSEIAPNYWVLLQSSSPADPSTNADLNLFLDSLRSIGGINSIILRLKALIQEHKSHSSGPRRSDIVLHSEIALNLLASLLAPDQTAFSLWSSTVDKLESPAKRRPLTHELVTLLSGGRIVSVAAEAEDVVREDRSKATIWVADGSQYSRWLGRNIVHWAKHSTSEEASKANADIFTRSVRLGYSDCITRTVIESLLLQPEPGPDHFVSLIKAVPQLEQRKFVFAVLKYLADHSLQLASTAEPGPNEAISAAAGLIARLLSQDTLKSHLVTWLTSASGAGLGDGIDIRRAVLAVLADDRDTLVAILEKSMNQFGDQLYIKHSPMLQQEAHAQVLLLTAGYVHRLSPLKLALTMRSSAYLHMISNRIGATQLRARFLGMMVGEALSKLSDKGEKKLDFEMEDTKSDEALWYKSLVNVSDKIGPVDSLLVKAKPESPKKPIVRPWASQPKPPPPKPKAQPKTSQPKRGFIIEEIDSDSDPSADPVPYPKPSSDPEDSDDDPTLVTRDHVKPPVYIRDLLAYLRATDSYDKQRLALATAPTLIRRKANFGTEVSSHADELASLLVGLQDNFDLENFHNLRIDSMVALVAAQPKGMAPWFAKTFFDGDYSLSQRAAVLVVLGLAARELAGLDTSSVAEAAAFPSKRLPEKMERLFVDDSSSKGRLEGGASSSLKALPATALDTIAQSLTAGFLAPIAATAADAVTGPDALKLATFTSRVKANAAGKQTTTKSRPRVRAIPNTTASLIATSFFAPLVALLQHALRTSTSSSSAISAAGARLVFEPNLLATYLKTLAVLVHAAGPSTLALPQMTAELWHLLLAVRGRTVGEPLVAHALLVALAAALEVNEARMRDVCQELGREVVETQEWVAAVFESTRGGDAGNEEAEIKMLAAAVLIRLREAVDKYRLLLLGDMIGYS